MAGVFALLALLVLAAAALWWWSGTDGSLRWVLEQVARSQPLTVEGVTGSLRSGLRVQRLVWEQDGLRVEAGEVHLEWEPQALLARQIRLDEVRAATVKVTDRRQPSAQPSQAPASLDLGLPYQLQLVLEAVAIGGFEWSGGTSVQLSDIAGRYGFDGTRHQLRLDGVNLAEVAGLGVSRYKGSATIGAQAPMPVETTVQGTVTTSVPGSTTSLPLSFTVSAQGPLSRMQARAIVEVAPAGAGSVGASQPQATVTAVVTPWAPQPVPQAQARLQSLDVRGFWPRAPRTRLSGDVRLEPAGTASWALEADLRNAEPGPWDAGRLPLESLKAEGEWRGGMGLVRSLQAGLGGGSLEAQGQWTGANGWTAEGSLSKVNPAALHSELAPTPLGGRFQVGQEGETIRFDTALQAAGPAGKPARLASGLPPIDLRELSAAGSWTQGLLTLPQLRLRTSDAVLQGSVTARPEARSGSGKLQLQAPGLQARLEGELAATRGRGTADVQARDLAQAQQWLQRWPFAPPVLSEWRAGGQADLQLAWQGGWNDPAVQASLSAPALTVQSAGATAGDGATAWSVRDLRASANGRLSDASLELKARAEQGQRTVVVDAAARGGRAGEDWRASVSKLELAVQDPAIGAGAWQVDVRERFDARWLGGPGRLEVGAGQAVLTAPRTPGGVVASQAVLTWEPLAWGGGELQTAGRLSGLPMAWVELFGGPQLAGSALSGNMVFDAQWNASLGAGLRLDASLSRASGDITVLAENAEGVSTRVPAGVREARLTLAGRDGNLMLAVQWDSQRAGTASGRIETRLARGGAAGWQWPADAPLTGGVKAELPRIGVWSLLAPPGWRLRGSLLADVAVAGSRADPQLTGTVRADELALRSVVDGIELRDGSLRARLQGRVLIVEEFVLQGAGEGGAGGTVVVSGRGQWTAGGPQLQATARLNRLRASIRSDRELTVSGQVAATLAPDGTEITGKLVVDRARIVIPDETPPRLGPDVVVRNAPGLATFAERAKKKPEGAPPQRPLNLAVQLDLGSDFRVTGRGINTRLAGTLELTGKSLTEPRLVGAVRAVNGEFAAYGQRLNIERGVLRFTGALANPALDILAVRPRLTQRVGVLVSGMAQSPYVRLYSEPDMPDSEKLSWLIVGRPAPSGGAEAALLQQAALSLLASRRGGASSGGLAGRFGLDELTVRRDDTAGAVVTLGKRFADNFYASYERSLSGALGTLYLFYDISTKLTLRAQAGERTAVDLIYTFSFD